MGPLDPNNPNFPVYLDMMQGKNASNRSGCGTGCGYALIVLLALAAIAVVTVLLT
jgi:hypothetical protein